MKEKTIKLLVVIGIISLIIGVYFFKTNENKNINIGENQIETMSQEEIDFSMEIVNGDLNIERLTSYGVPVIIDFGAGYCQPCKDFEPTLHTLKEQYGDSIIIKLVDIEEYEDIAIEYEIMTIPTQLFYNSDGTPYVPLSNMTNTNIVYKYDENENILFTKHTAGSSLNKMKVFLNEMGLDNTEEVLEFLGYTTTPTPNVSISK